MVFDSKNKEKEFLFIFYALKVYTDQGAFKLRVVLTLFI